MSSRASKEGSYIDHYVTASLLLLIAGAILSVLGIGPGFGAKAGIPVPFWGLAVVAGILFLYGLVKEIQS